MKVLHEEFVSRFQNYYQPLSTGRLSSFDSEKLGASFYHVAFLIYEISENRELYKTLLQVSVHNI
jgi:hypothetical protein